MNFNGFSKPRTNSKMLWLCQYIPKAKTEISFTLHFWISIYSVKAVAIETHQGVVTKCIFCCYHRGVFVTGYNVYNIPDNHNIFYSVMIGWI